MAHCVSMFSCVKVASANILSGFPKKNKAVNASSGSINITTNLAATNFEYCRGQLKELDK